MPPVSSRRLQAPLTGCVALPLPQRARGGDTSLIAASRPGAKEVDQRVWEEHAAGEDPLCDDATLLDLVGWWHLKETPTRA